jgi:NTE family protein
MSKKIGVALGGGGAKGLAHIAVLEVLDELGADVVAVSGTSIGAIMGTLYAAGMSGKEVRAAIEAILATPDTLEEAFSAKRTFGWLELLSIDLGRSYLLQADGFLTEFENLLPVSTFEELKCPMHVVAADFWEREEVVFDQGLIRPAVAASFCLPGIFKPVIIGDQVLVDGGCVNPVPFDLIRDECDVLVAVDVLGKREPEHDDLVPSYSDALFNVFQIAERTIANQKRKHHPPDVYIEPNITGVKVLEFQKAESIFEQSKPECDRLKRELEVLLTD